MRNSVDQSDGVSDRVGRSPVDVGIVTWNTRGVTVSALSRLVDQSGPGVRILVWDNASSDDTPEAIRRAVPEVEVLTSDVNLGFAAGMNRLIAEGSAPWFLALNSDAWPEAGAIDRLLAEGEREPRAAAVAPRLLRPNGALEHSTHPFPSLRVAAVTAVGYQGRLLRPLARRWLLNGVWAHDRPRTVDWAVGAALLMRRSALDEIGGFDERYFMYAEDLEWCWRAARAGWQVRFVPEAVVRHVGNASGAQSYGSRRSEAYYRNTYRFYRRHHSSAATVAYRLLNLLGAARLYAVNRIRGRPELAAFWWHQVPMHLVRTRGPDGPPLRQ